MYYRTNEHAYNFQNFRTTNTFGRDIYNGKITLKEANEDQSNLLVEILNFREKVKAKNPEKKQMKKMFLKTFIIFFKVEKEFLMIVIAKYFQ